MSDSVKFNQISQISMRVKDLDRATAFYRDVLGMEFIFQVPNMMSFFNCGGIRIMLAYATSEEFDHPGSIIYYRVDDIHSMHGNLAGQGVAFTREPHSIGQMGNIDVWMAFFEDSEGNTLAITSEFEIAD